MPDDEQHPRTVSAQVSNTATGETQDVVVDLTTGDIVSEDPVSDSIRDFFAQFGAMMDGADPDPD